MQTRLKRVAIISLGAVSLGVTALVAEAFNRAHIVPPAARAPSALYTRPEAWTPDGPSGAVFIGALNPDLQEQRVPVALSAIPKYLADAVLAVEDQRFYAHEGLDFKRIAGAFVANVKARGVAEGGSTITQQLAKNFFLSPSRNPIRKVREASIATVLEARYSKDQILEAYLNEVYLGQDGGTAIHGVGAASAFYFGKTVDKLTLAEAALLAGMIHAPNRVAPTRHVDEAIARRNLVLDLMVQQKRIASEVAGLASTEPVPTRNYPRMAIDARYFRDFVAKSTEASVPDRGTAIFTTLDARLQQSAEGAIAHGLARIRLPKVEAALVAVDPHTGDILAMVGGRDYATSQFNRATDAHRQPGSAFKPIVALAAFEGGAGSSAQFTLASMLEDEPLQVPTSRGTWEPLDYDGTFRGTVTLREALEQSLNIPFARIGLEVGPQRIASTAHTLGITSKLDAVPSLALGSSEVTLLEMVRAYGVFATGGKLTDSRWILSWRDPTGVTRDGPRPHVAEVTDAASAFLVTSALQGVVDHGTGAALHPHRFGGDIAGKTGTSNNWRDAWFIAYTPDIVVGAWVGYDDGRSVRLSGGAAAVPIVADFFSNAGKIFGKSFAVPATVEQSFVYTDVYWNCGRLEYFRRGTAPPDVSPIVNALVWHADAVDSVSQPDSLGTRQPCTGDRMP